MTRSLYLARRPAARRRRRRRPPPSAATAPQPRPAAFEALVRCRAIAEAAARLQCFDAAAAALQAAQERRDVVVVDRAQVREGRRRLFGLALPRIPIFGGGDDDDDDEDQVRTVEGVVAAATRTASATGWCRSQDGAVWSPDRQQPAGAAAAAGPARGDQPRARSAAS